MPPSIPPPSQRAVRGSDAADAPAPERALVAVRPYRSLLAFATGAVATFWGKNFTYLFLFSQVVGSPSWELVRRALEQLHDSYRGARDAMRGDPSAPNSLARATRMGELRVAYASAQTRADGRAMADLSAEMDELRREGGRRGEAGQQGTGGSEMSALLSVVDPDQFAALAKGMYAALVALTAAATSHGAAKVGLGINIGGTIAASVNATAFPALRRVLARPLERLCADQRARRWLDVGLSALCSSVGVGLAFYFEKLIFTAANALWGAELMASALADTLRARGLPAPRVPAMHAARWLIAACGISYQYFGSGRALPSGALMRLVLFAPLLAERSLQAAATAVRGLG